MIKVIGIGNRIMKDDGVAIHILECIGEDMSKISKNIQVISGETDVEFCIDKIDCTDYLIIIDSTFLGIEIGTVTTMEIKDYNGRNEIYSQHDLNLVSRLKDISILNGWIIGIEVFKVDFGLELSKELKERFNKICNKVMEEINSIVKIINKV